MIALMLALQIAKMDAPVSLDVDLVPVSGSAKSLQDAKGEKPLVVFFFNEQCGVTFLYKSRLQKLVKDFEPKFAFAGVRCGLKQDPKATLNLPETKYLAMPFFDDDKGTLMDRFGIGQSLTFAVIDAGSTLRYLGGFDDNVNEKNVTQTPLRDALRKLAAGKPVLVKRFSPMGCAILPIKP